MATFVDSLPIFPQRVILLRYLLGYPHDESARIVGTTPGSVRKLMQQIFGFGRSGG